MLLNFQTSENIPSSNDLLNEKNKGKHRIEDKLGIRVQEQTF